MHLGGQAPSCEARRTPRPELVRPSIERRVIRGTSSRRRGRPLPNSDILQSSTFIGTRIATSTEVPTRIGPDLLEVQPQDGQGARVESETSPYCP